MPTMDESASIPPRGFDIGEAEFDCHGLASADSQRIMRGHFRAGLSQGSRHLCFRGNVIVKSVFHVRRAIS